MARAKIRWVAMAVVLLGASPAIADPVVRLFIDDVNEVPVGTTRIMTNSVQNDGDAAATITQIEITGADAANFAFANPAAPACIGGQVCSEPFTVAAGRYSELDIACTPDRQVQFIATLVVTSNAVNSPTSARMYCDAAGPHIEFTPRTLTFPTTRIGYSVAPQVVQIHNAGNTDIRYEVAPTHNFWSPLQGPDCAFEVRCILPAGATISAEVHFVPQQAGLIMEQLSIVEIDRGHAGSATLPLVGNAIGADIKIDQPLPLDLGATLLGTTTPPGTIRIRSTGNEALHVTAAFLDDFAEASAFSITGPTVPFDLAPNATAEWHVTCHPVRLGDNVGILAIESNAGPAEYELSMQCTGSGGALEFAGETLAFPTTAVGSSSILPFIVRNIGNLPVTITAVDIGDPQFVARPHTGSLPITLSANSTTTFDLTFSPTRGGLQTGQITIADNGVRPFMGDTLGLGHSGHTDLTPAMPAFGLVRVGASTQLVAELRNNSDQTFTLTSITIADPTQFQIFDTTLIGSELAPDNSLEFAIQATLASLGPQDTQITFAFDHGPPTIVHVTATGVAAELAVETWDGSPIDGTANFGVVKVGRRATGLLSVTNTGTATLQIASCGVVGDPSFSVSPKCMFELAPAASADLEVTFIPATTGSHTAILRFTSDASTTMLDVTLVGTATPRAGCAAGRDEGGGLTVLLVGFAVIRWRSRRTRRTVAAVIALVLAGCGADGVNTIELSKPGSGTVMVTRTGAGSGVVRSLAHEIDCGTQCSATFTDAIHLAAIAAPGSVFIGWDGPCVGTGPCVITPSVSPAEVVARFEHQFRLTVDGDAPNSLFGGEVTVNGERCPFPCVRDVLEGAMVTLDVFTLSTFTGWTGGCTPTAAPCTLAITADVHLTAQFATPDERWTVVTDNFVPFAVTAVGDDPVVAGPDGTDVIVRRYTSTGTRTWQTRFAVGPNPQILGLDHNAGGQVYVLVHKDDPDFQLSGLILQKLDDDGRLLWSTTLVATSLLLLEDDFYSFRVSLNDALAVAPNGDAIIVGMSFVRAYADNGSVHWTQTIDGSPQDVAVSPDGIVTVPSQWSTTKRGQVDRYDPNGLHLSHYSLPRLDDSDDSNLETYHSFAVVGDQLICASTYDRPLFALRAVDLATGATTIWFEWLTAVFPKVALRADGHGNVLMLEPWGVVRKLAERAIAWRRAPGHRYSPGNSQDSQGGLDVTSDSQGRAIEVGSWARACSTNEICGPYGLHFSGFVRGYVP